jgi:threonine dehydratase
LSEICGCTIFLKKDFTQFTGSFKERGGRNSLMLLSAEEKEKGVITASAGNHALALAWHGKDLGIPVICVMPTSAPLTKVRYILCYYS